MLIAAVSLLLPTYALAREGALGPENNYLAPSGWQVFTSSQTLTCVPQYNNGPQEAKTPQLQTFQIVTQVTMPTRVGRNQSIQVRSRMNVITPEKFVTDLAKLNITNVFNSSSIVPVLSIGTQNTPGAPNWLYWPHDPSIFPESVGSVSPPIPSAHQGWSITLPPNSDSALLYKYYANQYAQIIDGDGILPNSTTSDVLIGFPGLLMQLAVVQNNKSTFLLSECGTFPITLQTYADFTNQNYSTTALTVNAASLVQDTPPIIPRSNPADHQPITNMPQDSFLTSVGIDYTCSVKGLSEPVSISLSLTTFVNASTLSNLKSFELLYTHGTFNLTKSVMSQIQQVVSSSISALQFEVFNISTTGTGISPSSVPILLHANELSAIGKPVTDGSLMIDFPGSNGVLDPVHYFANASHLGEPVTIISPPLDAVGGPGLHTWGFASSAKVLFGKIQMNIIPLDTKNRPIVYFYTECSPVAPTPLLSMSILCQNGTVTC